MANVFAGEVEFTTPRPFEARSARVKLQFTVDPGEDADRVVLLTGAAARNHAYAMINGGEVPIEAVEPTPMPEPPKTRTRQAKAAEGAQVDPFVAKPGTDASKAATDTGTGPSATPAAGPSEGAQVDPFVAAGAPVQSAPASAAASATVSNDPSPTPAAEITNEALQDAIKAKLASDAAYTAQVVELIQKFTGDPLAKIYTVEDQTRRAEFIAQLKAL